ncbi:MAG: hypothetical protein R2830_05440 [Saprospiraceae bacterium]
MKLVTRKQGASAGDYPGRVGQDGINLKTIPEGRRTPIIALPDVQGNPTVQWTLNGAWLTGLPSPI